MKSHFRSNYNRHKQFGDKTDRGAGVSKKNLSCFSCGMHGLKSTECRNMQSGKLLCKVCKNNTHNDNSNRIIKLIKQKQMIIPPAMHMHFH